MMRKKSLSPGQVLRELRKEKGLTLASVSKLSGVSISTISNIENEKSSPTFVVLAKLAEGLGASFPALVQWTATAFTPGCRVISRRGGNHHFETPRGGYEWLCTDLVEKSMEPALLRVTIRERPKELDRHGGEEFLYVLEGSIEFHMEFYAPLILEAGDCIYFDASVAHIAVAISEDDPLILSTTSQTRLELRMSEAERMTEDNN